MQRKTLVVLVLTIFASLSLVRTDDSDSEVENFFVFIFFSQIENSTRLCFSSLQDDDELAMRTGFGRISFLFSVRKAEKNSFLCSRKSDPEWKRSCRIDRVDARRETGRRNLRRLRESGGHRRRRVEQRRSKSTVSRHRARGFPSISLNSVRIGLKNKFDHVLTKFPREIFDFNISI